MSSLSFRDARRLVFSLISAAASCDFLSACKAFFVDFLFGAFNFESQLFSFCIEKTLACSLFLKVFGLFDKHVALLDLEVVALDSGLV